VEITQVGRFAFGLNDDSNAIFWASGKAGWFIIEPCDEYEPLFMDMSEAVICWYFVLDRYSSGKGKKLYKQIFADYAKEQGITQKDAQARFFKHADFIVGNMKKNTEGISWGLTSFYQHLRQEVPVSWREGQCQQG
jgi:hypothetical protein